MKLVIPIGNCGLAIWLSMISLLALGAMGVVSSPFFAVGILGMAGAFVVLALLIMFLWEHRDLLRT